LSILTWSNKYGKTSPPTGLSLLTAATAIRSGAKPSIPQNVTIMPIRAIRGARIPKTWFAFAAF
jgi:hypothetical protein